MSKKNPTPISIPRDGVQRTLNVTDAYQYLRIERTHFWKLRKKHNLPRTDKSTVANPRYRLTDIIRLGVDEGLLEVVDAQPQSGDARPAEPAPVEQPNSKSIPVVASQVGEQALPMAQSSDPSQVFAVDYYDSYLVPEDLRHLTVAEFRELKNPLAKPKPSK